MMIICDFTVFTKHIYYLDLRWSLISKVPSKKNRILLLQYLQLPTQLLFLDERCQYSDVTEGQRKFL